MQVIGLDHLVLTVRDLEATCEFYERLLGFKAITFGAGRKALTFGSQKINLHQSGHEFSPKAEHPTPGSADLCFITDLAMNDIVAHIESQKIPLVEGPVERTGARGPIRSVYFRDPDGNLIEVAVYDIATR